MKTLQFQSVGGASGDMVLAALFDVGADVDAVRAELARLDVDGFDVEVRPHTSHGLHGRQVHVRTDEAGGAHRHLSDIEQIVSGSNLDAGIKLRAMDVFRRIAEAEAIVHRTTPDQIHFHEVGAMDSIVDIVGASIALHQLDVQHVTVGALPLGQGEVTCAHGTIPVPAPATVELLKGLPVVQTDEPNELITPTGAALLSAWKSIDVPPAGSTIEKVGHGFGHAELAGRPNLLRAMIFESDDARVTDECVVVECNVDDTTPELLGSLVDRLLEEGALDVFTTPIQMKKQRPGTLITVLTRADLRSKLIDLVFQESTTFGVREYLAQRTILDRRIVSVHTEYGDIPVKIGTWRGQDVTFSPEMDDCIRVAREKSLSVRQVYEAARQAVSQYPSG